MPSKKFIYASVRFIGEDTYFYRTDDAMLREGDVVSVPTQKGEDIATVVSIKATRKRKFLIRSIKQNLSHVSSDQG